VPKCVLIVDDDPNVVDLLLNVMSLFGVETQVKHNGKDGLDAIKANPPDAVILDLMMPIMDGFTMLSMLRKEEVGKDMPVIVLSALADQKGMVDRLPGIIGTITKGKFSIIDLKDMLDKAGVFETTAASASASAATTPRAPVPTGTPASASQPAHAPMVAAAPSTAPNTLAPNSVSTSTPAPNGASAVIPTPSAPATVAATPAPDAPHVAAPVTPLVAPKPASNGSETAAEGNPMAKAS
jgi:CheY-like chemotaxis protein